MTIPKTCLKCGQLMIRGFVADHSHVTVFVSHWIEGEPERSVWRGVKASPKRALPIATYKCAACGFLESYASSEYGTK